MSGFVAQGGYGAYIWAAYGISALVLAAAAVLSWRAWCRAKRAIQDLETRI